MILQGLIIIGVLLAVIKILDSLLKKSLGEKSKRQIRYEKVFIE